MVNEFDETITAVLYVDGVAKQTLTYSVNNYLVDYHVGNPWDPYNEWGKLMNALYAYCVSARTYAEKNKHLQVQETYIVGEDVSYFDFFEKANKLFRKAIRR